MHEYDPPKRLQYLPAAERDTFAWMRLAPVTTALIAVNVLFFGLLGGAGYLGYRMIAGGGKQRAVGGRRSQKALGPGRRGSSSDDFERKMRELDAIEKRLDAEIGKR